MAEVVQRAFGCPDTVSYGDYHLKNLVGWSLAGRKTDDDGMMELLEPWRGHRQRVVRLLEIGVGVPVIEHLRTGWSIERPVRLTRTVLPSDRHQLRYELPS